MEKVILYTIGCPRCKTLERKLTEAGITFEHFTNVDEMLKMGMEMVPVLEVEGKRMEFVEAIKWVKERERYEK